MPDQLDYSHEVTVPEMLEARDRRVEIQRSMIAETKNPVVCFMLNVPGPHKVDDALTWAFETGVRRILAKLEAEGIPVSRSVTEREITGLVFYAAVEADAIQVKQRMCELEEADRLGRLFDIDVIGLDGRKVSREEFGMAPRKCLMCGKEAHICARNRSHTVQEMTTEIHRIIQAARGIAG